QLVTQNALKALALGWGGTLTEEQRERFNGIAASTELADRWGLFKPMIGKDLFIKLNFNFYQETGWIFFVNCPDDPIRAMCEVTAEWACPEELVQVNLPIGHYETPADGTVAFVYMGKSVTQTTNYYKGPWRLSGTNLFEGGEWSEDPWWPYPGYNVEFGARVFLEVFVCHGDLGWTSSRFKTYVDIEECGGRSGGDAMAAYIGRPPRTNWAKKVLEKRR
ncbi:unnamed protein product, partial [marine sediment metagenome]